jgi:hypothetical protein
MSSTTHFFKLDDERNRMLRAEGPSVVKMGRARYFST